MIDGSMRVSEARDLGLGEFYAVVFGAPPRSVKKALTEARGNARVDTALDRWWKRGTEPWAAVLGVLRVVDVRDDLFVEAVAALLGRSQSWVQKKLSEAHGNTRVDKVFAREWPASEEALPARNDKAASPPTRLAFEETVAAPAPKTRRAAPVRTLRGRYELTRLLGKGGFGEAWEARDTLGDDRVVIKLAFSTEPLATLLQELKPARVLSHTHICRYITIDKDDDGSPFIVMEHGGSSLLDRLKDGWTPTVKERLRTIEAVASALDYAHSRQVLHLDVSPQNVLLDDQAHVRLTDFGVSRIGQLVDRTQGGQTVMASHAIGLNPSYCAPEMLLGGAIGRAADQYSLAALYVVLVTRTPLTKRLPTTFSPLRGLSTDANMALARALSTEPSRRFRSCTEFVERLSQ